MAYPNSHNPFAEDDDDEDFKPKSRGFNDDPDYSGLTEAERKQRYLQQEVMRTAQSAVDSSYRSLGLIYESEKMGVETAEVCWSIYLLPSIIHPTIKLLIPPSHILLFNHPSIHPSFFLVSKKERWVDGWITSFCIYLCRSWCDRAKL